MRAYGNFVFQHLLVLVPCLLLHLVVELTALLLKLQPLFHFLLLLLYLEKQTTADSKLKALVSWNQVYSIFAIMQFTNHAIIMIENSAQFFKL